MSELRDAGPADLAALTEVFLDCWRLSYAEVLPAELVAAMTEQKASAMLERSLANVASSCIVALSDAAPRAVQGFVVARIEPDGTGYIASLYVAPTAQGSGSGRRLLTAAESRLAERGVSLARLWVFRDNAPSLAFYERQGWSVDGRTETLEEWGQPQLGMSKRLVAEGESSDRAGHGSPR